MNWSLYSYLAGIGVLCVITLFVFWRLMPSLLRKSGRASVLETLVLCLAVTLGLLTIYFNYYRGTLSFAYLDVGNDTIEQYVPYYSNMIDAIKSGNLGFWNHEYGLGVSFMSYQSWTLDPFNLVFVPLALLLGNARIPLALVLVQSLKVYVVALIFDRLLTYYCQTPLSRVLGSLLCCFSGYLMLWGQHYWLGTVFVMATAMPLLLERYIERNTAGRFAALAAGTALCIISSVYSGFMVMLFATAYALFRVAYVCKGGIRGFFGLFGRLTIPVVCGILISCITVVPYATLMLGESTRVVGEQNGSVLGRVMTYLSAFVPLQWIPMILSRMLGNGLVSYGQAINDAIMPPTQGFSYVNIYEIITLGLSGAAFVLLSQFAAWVVAQADRKAKVLVLAVTVLILLYGFNFFLPAFSNAFVAPKYRSSFAVVIPACIAMAVGFDRRVVTHTVARLPLLASVVLSAGVIAWSLVNTIDGRLACLWYLLMLCATTVLLWQFSDGVVPVIQKAGPSSSEDDNSQPTVLDGRVSPGASHSPHESVNAPVQKALAYCLLCMAIASTSIADGFFSTNIRNICTPDNMPGATQSGHGEDTMAALTWLKENDTTFWRAEKLYSDWTWLNDSLFQHYRGISSYNSTLDGDVEEFYQQLWPEALAGDTAYQAYGNNPEQPALLCLLGVKYLLSREPLNWDWCSEINRFGEVYVYRNMQADSILTLRSGVLAESEVAQLDAAGRREMLAASSIVPDDDVKAYASTAPSMLTLDDLASLDLSWMHFEEWEMGDNGLPAMVPSSQAQVSCTDGKRLEGRLFANVDSIACLAIPHVSGWKVLVDGQEVDTTRTNYGFIGFAVPAGMHTIEASYTAPNLGLGAAISCAGLVGVLAGCIVIARRQAR